MLGRKERIGLETGARVIDVCLVVNLPSPCRICVVSVQVSTINARNLITQSD